MADRRTQAQLLRDQANRQTTDELFAAEYAKKGLQPTNVIIERSQEADRQAARAAAQMEAIDAQELAQLNNQIAYERELQALRLEQQTQEDTEEAATGSTTPDLPRKNLLRNTATAWAMTLSHGWFYITVQLPLAIMALVFFGIWAGLETSWIGRRVSEVAGAVNSITSIFGADFSALAPQNIFFVLTMILMGLALLGILVTIFSYAIRGQNPLFGSHETRKVGTLLLCFIGYAIPFLNLFPWIGLYIFVMWRSPR